MFCGARRLLVLVMAVLGASSVGEGEAFDHNNVIGGLPEIYVAIARFTNHLTLPLLSLVSRAHWALAPQVLQVQDVTFGQIAELLFQSEVCLKAYHRILYRYNITGIRARETLTYIHTIGPNLLSTAVLTLMLPGYGAELRMHKDPWILTATFNTFGKWVAEDASLRIPTFLTLLSRADGLDTSARNYFAYRLLKELTVEQLASAGLMHPHCMLLFEGITVGSLDVAKLCLLRDVFWASIHLLPPELSKTCYLDHLSRAFARATAAGLRALADLFLREAETLQVPNPLSWRDSTGRTPFHHLVGVHNITSRMIDVMEVLGGDRYATDDNGRTVEESNEIFRMRQ